MFEKKNLRFFFSKERRGINMRSKSFFRSLFINLIPIVLPIFGFIILAISVATMISHEAKKEEDFEGEEFKEETETSYVRIIEKINIC